MPATVTFSTLATASMDGIPVTTRFNFTVPDAALVNGVNTIAVEVRGTGYGASPRLLPLDAPALTLAAPTPPPRLAFFHHRCTNRPRKARCWRSTWPSSWFRAWHRRHRRPRRLRASGPPNPHRRRSGPNPTRLPSPPVTTPTARDPKTRPRQTRLHRRLLPLLRSRLRLRQRPRQHPSARLRHRHQAAVRARAPP